MQRRAPRFVVAVAAALLLSGGARGAEQPKAPAKRQAHKARPAPALTKQLGDLREIIFACRQPGRDSHWYANFGYYAQDANRKAYGALGRLCKLDLKTGKVTVLLDDPKGSVRDPQVHYDAKKILFSYRRGGSDYFHLYEINVDPSASPRSAPLTAGATGGTGLKQITSGEFDDIEPTYLPGEGIMFVSSRCKRWVNCWLTQVSVLYRCDLPASPRRAGQAGAGGGGIRPVSSNIQHDNTPWPLPDGRVLYQRWEYVDRSQVHYHHLWTTNPDGTGQMVFYGNLNPGTLMIDAKPIPGTGDVVAVFSPGHGRREHEGHITIVSPRRGPDHLPSARRISKGRGDYRDPYALSPGLFLVSHRDRIELMDARGATQTVYRLPPELARRGMQVHEPRPLRPRKRERLIPPRVATKAPTGRLLLADVYTGRNMAGVKRGDIARLLVLETLPKPINYTGGMEPLSYGGTFTLPRILGTVPVAEDGSAYMEVPAMRSLFFVALDADNNSVKRMQSFLTVMPGETTSCAGCHEPRTQAPGNHGHRTAAALKGEPSPITPLKGIPDVFDFPRDIQPILDAHCVRCHNPDKYAGRVLLAGDRGPLYSHAYVTLTVRRQFADGRNRARSNLPPRSIGAVASPLMKKISGAHHDVKVTPHQREVIRYWIESGAPYPGTYAALGCGMIGGYAENRQDQHDRRWPSTIAAAGAVRRRCTACHRRFMHVPLALSDNRGVPLWRGRPGYSPRHLVFNLTRPQKSLVLLAPLSKKGGGLGLCRELDAAGKPGKPVTVFADTKDPDYRKILAMCRDGNKQLDKIKRFDMPGFRPTAAYIREMQKYGILSRNLAPDAPVDVYATDRAYWRSLWWRAQQAPISAASARKRYPAAARRPP